VGTSCDFDNHEHGAWTNPFTNAQSHAGFDELYRQALEAAIGNIARLVTNEPSANITDGLNFKGAIV
jgi:truncated hemoglobin YjbI